MKLESLIIIFFIIIMPISLVTTEYIDNKIKIEETRLQYDTKLINATYAAIKAYQINTVNNAFSDVTNSKISDIEASVNTFYSNLAASFNYTGYKSTVMKEYVPAIAYTLYDGYYIYSPFYNTLTEVDSAVDESYSKPGEATDGLKPYVYYSCRYKYTPGSSLDSNSDFIITYTLDNYITIQGLIKGQYIYDCGYLYSIVNDSTAANNGHGIYKQGKSSYIYDGVTFSENDKEELKEYVGNTEYSYAKINGMKYYLEEKDSKETIDTYGIDKEAKIFYINNKGQKDYSQLYNKTYEQMDTDQRKEFRKYYNAITKNKSAYEYYKNAYEFSKAVLESPVSGYKDKAGNDVTNGYGLQNLKNSDAEFYKKQQEETTSDITSLLEYGNEKIFDISSENIESASSKFNTHRKAIIRYVIETNLASAIQGYQSKSKTVTEYIMPKISETDWDIIQNNVCAITFMQGMSLGSKKYNGYAVVANTLTKEYISEDDIYFLKKDNTYCRVNEKDVTYNSLKAGTGYFPGVWKINFERKKDISTGTSVYYFPLSSQTGQGYLGSYKSIMGNSSIDPINYSDMYAYVHSWNKIPQKGDKLKKVYYAALGRERWGSFNINNINYELNGSNSHDEYFLKDYESASQ